MTAERSAEPTGDTCPRCHHEVGGSWLVCAWCGETLTTAAELEIGSRFGDGRYEVLSILGRGGFGITYAVRDDRLHRSVAVKELFPETAVRHRSVVLAPPGEREAFALARERFLREARVLARFTHPGIVRVYEVFEANGTAYLVMELIEGRTLVDVLRQRGRPLPEAELLDVAGRVAAALRPLHAVDVLHRDINPSNVMVTDGGRVVLIDFGLARDVEPEVTSGLTRIVTPGYAPPEQYRGEGRFGPATDVYGLAATLYRLATGRVPVTSIERDAGRELPAPHRLNPSISKAVGDAILDGLELEPDHRPRDLDSFLARLGITGLPTEPRSSLVDLVPPPVPVEAAPEPSVVDTPRPPDSSRQRPVRRSLPTVMPGPTPDPDLTAPDGVDATRVLPLVPDPQGVGSPTGGPALVPEAGSSDPRFAPSVHAGTSAPSGRWFRVPAAMALAAAASAAPVVVPAALMLVVLPSLAALGVNTRRSVEGGRRRLPDAAAVILRFPLELLRSVLREIPAIVLTAVLLIAHRALVDLDVASVVTTGLLRLTGVIAVTALLVGTARPDGRADIAFGLERIMTRLRPGRRITEAVVITWILCLGGAVAGLALAPTTFPLP